MSSQKFPISQEREGEWTSPSTFLIQGVPILQFFTPDPAVLYSYVVNFETRAEDVFVVSYPKSGTTWLQEILWQLFNNGEKSSRKIFERVPFLERATSPDRPDIRALPSPRLLHSHLTYDVIPKGNQNATICKYIYIARNPKDVAVSFYEFMKDHGSEAGYNGPWEFFAKLFMEGKVSYGRWNDHVIGWWKHADDPNVLFLRFEDLKKDLSRQVRIIAEFLEKPVTEDVINRIAEQCTFKGMMMNASNYWLGDSAEGPKLLRKGEIGDWKNYFTSDLNEKFENEVMNKIKGTGLVFDFGVDFQNSCDCAK